MTGGPPDQPLPDLDRLRSAVAEARDFYVARLHALPKSGGPRGYLRDRCGDRQLAETWQLGYAPAGWTHLVDHLHHSGYTDSQLLDAGLALRTRRGTVVDRFRDRLLAPYHDDHGRPIGFVGRAAPKVGPDVPRYLNSPDSPIFHKYQHLLGLHPARPLLERGAVPVLVEGLFDALAVTAAADGRWAGIAPSGTALTPAQVHGLDRVVALAERGVVVAYDNDPAGQTAAARTFGLLAATGAWPQHAVVGSGSDPGQMPAAELNEMLTAAAQRPLVALAIGVTIAQHVDHLDTPGGRAACANALAATLTPSPDQTRIDELLPATAALIGCTAEQLALVLSRHRNATTQHTVVAPQQVPQVPDHRSAYGRGMAWSTYGSFLVFAIVLVLVPGPDFAVVTKNTLAADHRRGAWSAVGVASANAVQGIAAAAGLGAVIVRVEPLFQAVKWAGIAYLLFLGFQALLSAKRGDYLQDLNGGSPDGQQLKGWPSLSGVPVQHHEPEGAGVLPRGTAAVSRTARDS